MIIACGQDEILPYECVECGGWLSSEHPGGYQPDGKRGLAYCSEDCIISYQDRAGQAALTSHLHVRDLLCNCPKVCAPAGRPTTAEVHEYGTYIADLSTGATT